MIEKHCEECEKLFTPVDEHHPYQKFCSKKCQRREGYRRYKNKEIRPMNERHCDECGKLFTPVDKHHPNQRFCGKTCMKRSRDRRFYKAHTEHMLNKNGNKAKLWREKNKLEGKCSRCKNKLPDGWEGLVCPDCRTTVQMIRQHV